MIATRFTSWQSHPLQPDPKRCSPNLTVLRDHLLARWGGKSLGCYAARPIRGGSSLSSHASGAALDWRWDNPGPGRAVLDLQVLPWLIGNSAELGIQAIHDYKSSRIWRPPAYRDAAGQDHANGWRWSSGSDMGEDYARWIHIEVHPSAWSDARPVDQKIGGTAPPPPKPDPSPPPLSVSKEPTVIIVSAFPVLHPGATGRNVEVFQTLANLVHNAGLTVDGQYGGASQAVCNLVRTVNGLGAGNVVDDAVWAHMLPKT